MGEEAASLVGYYCASDGCASTKPRFAAGTKFCGRCGSTMEIHIGGYKRVCTACGHEIFPRTDPVVIMLAVDGERCLLGRQTRFPRGMYSALAGFVEPGPRHAEAPRSRFEAGTYGVVEKDVDVHDIRRAAQARGFRDLRMCVFHGRPYHASLDRPHPAEVDHRVVRLPRDPLELGSLLDVRDEVHQLLVRLVAGPERLVQELQVRQDVGERIVDLVGNPGGQGADHGVRLIAS